MRYFFHLRENHDYVVDEEGIELADLDAVRIAATAAARSVIASDAMTGKLPLRAVLEVNDGNGQRVLELPFRDTVLVDG